MRENSDEFKQLGTLTKEKRIIDYYPQDDKAVFTTKPKNMTRQQMEEFQILMNDRVPSNLVGNTLRQVRQNTDDFNKYMINDQLSKT
jgi:hypothetical protein